MPRFATAILLASVAAVTVRAQVKVLLVSEPAQQNMVVKFEEGIKAAENANADLNVDIVENIKIDRSAQATYGFFHYSH